MYLAQGNYESALKQATRSLQLAKQQRLTRDVQEASFTLSLIYAALKDYPKAYEHLRQYTALRDTLFNQEITNLAVLRNGLEINQKQDQVNLLWKEKEVQAGVLDELTQRNYALLAGVLLFFTLVSVINGPIVCWPSRLSSWKDNASASWNKLLNTNKPKRRWPPCGRR